jgi:hypothetical protein
VLIQYVSALIYMHGLSIGPVTSIAPLGAQQIAHIYYYNRDLMGKPNAAVTSVVTLRGEVKHHYTAVHARILLRNTDLPF